MSVSPFHRKFRDTMGMVPLQCQKRLRLAEARRLMLEAGRNVTEAALEVGHENLSRFIRDYGRAFVHAPGKDVAARGGGVPWTHRHESSARPSVRGKRRAGDTGKATSGTFVKFAVRFASVPRGMRASVYSRMRPHEKLTFLADFFLPSVMCL